MLRGLDSSLLLTLAFVGDFSLLERIESSDFLLKNFEDGFSRAIFWIEVVLGEIFRFRF